jgi:hypothetical protein
MRLWLTLGFALASGGAVAQVPPPGDTQTSTRPSRAPVYYSAYSGFLVHRTNESLASADKPPASTSASGAETKTAEPAARRARPDFSHMGLPCEPRPRLCTEVLQ